MQMGFFRLITRLIGKSIFLFFDYLLLLFIIPKDSDRVCLIRLDAIGDFFLWLDTAKHYRQLYPGKKITLVGNTTWVEVAKQLPYWDEVWAIDVKRLGRNPIYRLSILREIRRAGFDVAIQPTYSRCLMEGDSLVRASGARERIGSAGVGGNITTRGKSISDRWYTRLLPVAQIELMELERNAEFISHLSGTSFNSSVASLPVLATLPSHLIPEKRYFILFPGASWQSRQWPVEYFARVADVLTEQYGWQAVVCGSVAESRLSDLLIGLANVSVLNFVGRTNLIDFGEVVRGAELLIGNETSAVHIAAAVSTPSVCILGGGHFGRFMPYGASCHGEKPLAVSHRMPCFNCKWRCNQPLKPSEPVPCIAHITVEQVLDAINTRISTIRHVSD